ncbi:MAG: DUF1828 domain-containing protein [Myxococcota bacterium]
MKEIVTSFTLVRSCDETASGALRVSTPFRYPDTSNIDLFIEPPNQLFPNGTRLSDFGQTTDYLLQFGLAPWATKKRKTLIDDVCASLDVEYDRGKLFIDVPNESLDLMPSAMVRLGQACIRTADIVLTKRNHAPNSFNDEFEEYLAQREVSFETNVSVHGLYGRDIKVDFRTRGQRVSSLVQTLSTAYQSSAHTIALEAFRKWHDMGSDVKSKNQLLTVYDSSKQVFRDDDLQRLEADSVVIAFPAQADQFIDLVAA